MTPTRVLVVDDDPGMCAMLRTRLAVRGFVVETTVVAAEAVAAVQQRVFDVVVTDVNMKGMNGVELCKRLLEHRPQLPVILITAFGSMDIAIQAIRAGAYDFLPKPFEIDQLGLAIERGATLVRLRAEMQVLRQLVAPTTFGELVGSSPRMRDLYAKLSKIAENDASVLLTGESGTGKELVARAIHGSGPRAGGPFVAINCAAMPTQLLESELFGHEKGAFTGAVKTAKLGLGSTLAEWRHAVPRRGRRRCRPRDAGQAAARAAGARRFEPCWRRSAEVQGRCRAWSRATNKRPRGARSPRAAVPRRSILSASTC